MTVTDALLDILIVLVAAKVAAELMERLNIPAVVGEILAGILIGPSVLDLVSSSDVLRVLGEIGVILLLLEVGSELELSELAAVGRASLTVAIVGVILPFVGGAAFGSAVGMTGKEAIFVGAALTATSVGITARVLGDLKALAMVESRTVLGAAVADDVIGLVILTVVVRLATSGSVSALSVLWIVFVAVAFLAVTAYVGVRFVPGFFDWIARQSRSSGTLVAIALAFTLAIAELANEAKLAPIVGAFVAGLALGRSSSSDRIRRELQPVGHLFIPVFFLTIGIEVDVAQFAKPSVLAIAGVLFVIAVAGKLAAGVGMIGSPGDRILVGIGMIPRGEVGLIFATIGLSQAIIGQRDYAAILLVVLLTTLATPPVLRSRLERMRRGATGAARPTSAPTRGRVARVGRRPRWHGVVDLVAIPPIGEALDVGMQAALMLDEQHRPGERLVDWLGQLPSAPLRFDRGARQTFFTMLERGRPRSWRFLQITGLLDRALPELGEAIARREPSALDLDPFGALHWATLDAVHRELADRVARRLPPLAHPEWVELAALVLDASGGSQPPVLLARRVMQRLDLGAAPEQAVAALVGDAGLLRRAALRPDALAEETVLQLAAHLGTPEQARGLAVLTVAAEEPDARRARTHRCASRAHRSRPRSSRAHEPVGEQHSRATAQCRGAIDRRPEGEAAARDRAARVCPRADARGAGASGGAVRARGDRRRGTCGCRRRRAESVAHRSGRRGPNRSSVARRCRHERARLRHRGRGRVHVARRRGPDQLRSASSGAATRVRSGGSGARRIAWGARLTAGRGCDGDLRRRGLSVAHDLPGGDDRSPRVARSGHRGVRRRGGSVHSARITTNGAAVADTFEMTDDRGAKLDPAHQARIRELIHSGVRPGRRRRFARRA